MAEQKTDADFDRDFATVFYDHVQLVWRVLRRFGVAEADVDDVCQEVFVVVHRKLPEFEGRSSLKTWIHSICVRTASDYRRKAHRRHEIVTGTPPEIVEKSRQDEEVERQQTLARLDEALSALDEDKRAVLVLFELEGAPMADVAEALGCPLKTGYSRLYAARRELKAALERMSERGGQQ